MNPFLVELGVEELPPTSLKMLSEAFADGLENQFKSANLSYAEVNVYATPRRIAIVVSDLLNKTPLEELKVWGPPAAIDFDDAGKPTKAAEAFAKKNNTAVESLHTENDGKIDKLLCRKTSGGVLVETLLGEMVNHALNSLPIKKRMRWGASRNEFVRPVHWVLMLLGEKILTHDVLGLMSAGTTRGHRFHCNQTLKINAPEAYARTLQEKGKVIADFAERQSIIVEQVKEKAKEVGGFAVISDDLLEEVTALVEWPVAILGKFDQKFLSVPAEALISSMKAHQKYFHLTNERGELLPYFITVSNIDSRDMAQVIDGNERVIRPRLADAAFFYQEDKKLSLQDRQEKLKTVVFQKKLGSVFDKTERISALGINIARALGTDESLISRAGQLCKSDLVSSMVYEFADMQGIAGYHYAVNDGEKDEVALAMKEQYLPRFAGDELATSSTGAILGLADRLDTIVGIFGIGQAPTGSKDPFGLRRSAIGALRILVEKEYDLDLRDLILQSIDGFTQVSQKTLVNADTLVDDVLSYMLERFRAWYEEAGFSAEIFQAVSARRLSNPLEINLRVYAVAEFCKLSEATTLAAANKRVSNILSKQKHLPTSTVEKTLLSEPAEKSLAENVSKLQQKLKPLIANKSYTEALSALASLRQPVDTFFDEVMVMTEDEALKNNRLALLAQLRALFLNVADISFLVVKN